MQQTPLLYAPPPQVPITLRGQYANSYRHTELSGTNFYAEFAEEAWMPSEDVLRDTYHDDRGDADHLWNQVNAATVGQIGRVPPSMIIPHTIPLFPVPFDHAFGDHATLWEQPTYYQ